MCPDHGCLCARVCLLGALYALAKRKPGTELPILWQLGKGDDTFFHEFLQCCYPSEIVENVKPNLVEHVDWLLGGSTLQQWRDYLARAEYWDDEDLIAALRERIKARV